MALSKCDIKSFKRVFSTIVHSWLVIFSAVLFSCNEEEDEISPRVIVESPFENQSFQSTDTIEAIATISDNEQVRSVELELLDLDFNLVGRKESYLVSGSQVNFGQLYPIDGALLSSGDYYLAFRAKYDFNVGSGFVKIRINAAPRRLEGVIVITKESNQTFVYYRESNELSFQLKLNYFSDAIGAGLNYRQDIIMTAGGEAGDAVFIELDEFEQVGSIPGFGSIGLPFFVAGTYEQNIERFFVAERDGVIRVRGKEATPLLSFNSLPEHIPQEVFGSTEGYFLAEKEIDSPLVVLTLYSFQGLLLDVFQVAGSVRGVYDRNFNEKFIWVDNPLGFELRLLDLSTEFLSLPFQRKGSRLEDVVRISSNTFVLSTSDGLLRYNFSNGGVSPINNSAPQGELFFDELNQLIYLVEGEQIRIYETDGNEIGGVSFEQEIVFVGFDYNR